MGLAWCRERLEQAQNSKSPVDRILVCCSNAIRAKSSYSHSQGKVANDFVYKGMRSKDLGISHPVPIHAVPPRTRNRTQKTSDWHQCSLSVPDSLDASKPPVPPPRKKRKRTLNSREVLNNELPELHSPSYVLQSNSLLNKGNEESGEVGEMDVLRPLEKSFQKERAGGCDRLGKLSISRGRKIKRESHPNDVKEKRVKNDNEKRSEQKIKHVSTVSLPNYNELIKPSRNVSTDVENSNDKTGNQSAGLKHPRRDSSTISLPGEGSNSILSSLSEATIARLEAYMKRCRSFGALKPQQLLEKLEEFNKTHRSSSESSDSWCGLDDWDLGVIEYCSSEQILTPKSTLPARVEKGQNFPSKNEQKGEETKGETEGATKGATKGATEGATEGATYPRVESSPMIHRSQSIIEGVPIEWFLDPSLRAPAIMPPPPEVMETPPPSPENENQGEAQDHSSLLNILRQYKADERSGPEVAVEVTEVASDMESSLSFEEVDVRIPIAETLNPFLPAPVKNRSSSIAGDQLKLLQESSQRFRSPSIGYESSANLIHQLKTNEEEIEKEILLRPNELLVNLRRESLCESLPEDAFEAFVCKRKPSLRESLKDFLGFQDEKKPEDEKSDSAEAPEKEDEEEKKEQEEEKCPPTAPPLPVNPPPVLVNETEETNTPVPCSLVK